MFLFLANVKYVSSSVLDSLRFCYFRLIPSLYPFMVLSSTMLYTTRLYCDSKLLNYILGNCKIYSNEIVMGLLCGFVIGAKGICQKYNENTDIDDLNNGIFLSSNAGIGFVIGCVGCVIYNDIGFGIFLYIAQILSGYLIFKFSEKKKACHDIFINYTEKNNLFDGIVKSVKSSTSTILVVCSFNVFFSTLCDLIIMVCRCKDSSFGIIIKAIFDFSRGVFAISEFNNFYACGFLTGFCVGFGGICVYMQICAECEKIPFKRVKFLNMKLIQGIACGILSFIYFKIFKCF